MPIIREIKHKITSTAFTHLLLFGIKLSYLNIRLRTGGITNTGRGKKALLQADYAIAFLPATLDLPYSIVPSILYTDTPLLSSLHLIKIKLAELAVDPARIAIKELAKISCGPLI